MAIRAVDLQLSILQAPIIATVIQQQETAPGRALTSAEEQFAARLVEREETVKEIRPAAGNRVERRRQPDDERGDPPRRGSQRRPRRPHDRLEDMALGVVWGANHGHIIDVKV